MAWRRVTPRLAGRERGARPREALALKEAFRGAKASAAASEATTPSAGSPQASADSLPARKRVVAGAMDDSWAKWARNEGQVAAKAREDEGR